MEARMCWEFSHGLADISILSRARSEGYNLLISANPCKNSKHILASMIYFDSDMSKYKYGSILWLEDGNLLFMLAKMSHTIYVTRITLRPLSALFGLQFMLKMGKSVTFIGACANEIIPNG